MADHQRWYALPGDHGSAGGTTGHDAPITAATLELLGNGTAQLDNGQLVDELAANLGGGLTFVNQQGGAPSRAACARCAIRAAGRSGWRTTTSIARPRKAAQRSWIASSGNWAS